MSSAPGPAFMFCLGCGYDLLATTSGRCSECGRTFDPADPRSYRATPLPRGPTVPWLECLHLAVVLGSLAPFTMPHVCFLVARVSLGRWPRPMQDDPAYSCGIAPLYYLAWLSFGCVLLLPAVAIGPIVAVAERRWGALGRMAAVTAAAWGGAVLLWRWLSPHPIRAWFID